MDNIEALLTTLKIYIETPSKVTQGFYQGLCVKAKETIEHLQAELQPAKEENEWFRQDNEWKDVVHNQTNAIGKLRAELQQVKEENGRLKKSLIIAIDYVKGYRCGRTREGKLKDIETGHY